MAANSTDGDRLEVSSVSWGAVIAGALTSAALTLFLAALGVGLGLSAVSPWANEGVSATTFKVGSGLYLIAVAMLAGTVGGYLAGRLRTKWTSLHDHEIYFSDTAHGLVVWALATVLTAGVLGAATTHILAGASAGLAPAAANSASAGNPTDVYVDSLLRADPAQPAAANPAQPSAPSNASNAATRAELGRILLPALRKGGDVPAADRTYVVKVVSARTGLSQPDAEKRVSDVIAQAKKAADDARRTAASMALWFAAAMLAGAVASMLGATEGGLLRDSRWYEPGWRTTVTRTHW
jgi:hypothetical protein